MATIQIRRPVPAQAQWETTGYTCNQCGKSESIDPEVAHSIYYLNANYHGFSVEGGYDTDFPGDMVRVTYHLCSACLQAMVEGFKVPATWLNTYKAELADVGPLYWVEDDGDGGPAFTLIQEKAHDWWLVPPESQERYDAETWESLNQKWEDANEGVGDPRKGVIIEWLGESWEIEEPALVIHYETKEPFAVMRALFGDSKRILLSMKPEEA